MTADKTEQENTKSNHVAYIWISIICFLVAGVLSFNLVRPTQRREFPTPRETNVTLIQEWMTIDYISHTYKVPTSVLAEKLQQDLANEKRLTIKSIARNKSTTSAAIIKEVQTIITEFQSTHTKPPQQPES